MFFLAHIAQCSKLINVNKDAGLANKLKGLLGSFNAEVTKDGRNDVLVYPRNRHDCNTIKALVSSEDFNHGFKTGGHSRDGGMYIVEWQNP